MFTVYVDGRAIQTTRDAKKAMQMYKHFKERGYDVDVLVGNTPETQRTHIGKVGAAA